MAKSREDRAEAEAWQKLAAQRIWPIWSRSLGAMIEAEAIVRFACDVCRRVYDVDVAALAVLRGREWSLIGRSARCKASKCRAPGRFVAAAGREAPFGSDQVPGVAVGLPKTTALPKANAAR